jgi:hypothetical protein
MHRLIRKNLKQKKACNFAGFNVNKTLKIKPKRKMPNSVFLVYLHHKHHQVLDDT